MAVDWRRHITYDFSCWKCKQRNVTYVPKGNDLQIAPHKSPKGNDCDGGVSLNESYGRIIIKRL